MMNRVWINCVAVATMLFSLYGCGSGSDAAKKPSLASAEAPSNHYVIASFTGTPTADADNPDNYSIVDTRGKTLEVIDAELIDNGQKVMLVTASQSPLEYQLTQYDSQALNHSVSDFFIKPAVAATNTTSFTGSLQPEPALLTAISLNSTSVLLTFNEGMSSLAEVIEYYRIVATDASAPTRDVGDVQITAASLGDDTTTVILTTTPQDNIEFNIKVTNITSQPSDMRIDPFHNTTTFFGIAPIDSDAPRVTDVDSTAATTMVITFSEPLGDAGDDPSNYTIYYCLVEQDPCLPENRVELLITDASLNQHNTQVVLSTLPQEVGIEYIVEVNNVQDQNGNQITSTANTASTSYSGGNDSSTALLAPRVLGASSSSNTTVLVSFSKSMDASAEVAQNYVIVQENVNSEAGALAVIDARYVGNSRSTVELTTRSQNELTYRVTVINVKDTQGQPLDTQFTNGGLFSANSVLFAGTAPGGDTLVDSDGDGISDSEEQRGYEVVFVDYNNEVVRQQVTSDSLLVDTDNDGINDADEKHYRTNPRDSDTDDDALTDYQELNEIYSEPLKQDSDGDGLTDGLEFNFFHTSPLFADTDGDQLLDFYEITVNRNPRVADLPQLDIEVGDVNLQLDYRFDITKEGTTSKGTTKNVSSTLTQSSATEYSKSDSNSHSFDVKLGFEQQMEFAATSIVPKWNLNLSQELSTNNSWTSSVSRNSSEASTREYAKSLESNLEVTRGETVSRVIEGAKISVPVYIKSSNDIAFNISNIIVTALIPSADDPAKLIPVATLVPAAEPTSPYTLGPLLPARGPLEFVQDSIYPSVVEDLMANPRGIIFKVANYNITDEFDRDFAFTSQEIAERTAPLIFDHGGVDLDGDGLSDNPERYRVAVNYGFDVTDDNRVIFDSNGKLLGASFSNVLEEVLGMTRYDEDITPTDTLSVDQLYNSYSVKQCDYGSIIYRVRGTAAITTGNKCEIVKGWGVIQPDGSVFPRGDMFPAQLIMKPNRGVRLAYYADEDADGLPNRAEYLYGCSASEADTDNDNLGDRFEVLGARRGGEDGSIAIDDNGNPLPADSVWLVELKSGDVYEARARCDSIDSDYDGLSDREEYERKLYQRDELSGDLVTDDNGNLIEVADFADLLEVIRDSNGNITGGGRTDPLKQDTDGDGISDNDEIRGYYVDLKFPLDEGNSRCTIPANGDAYRVLCTSNPLAADTDGDTLNDGDEIRLGGDPTLKDNDDIGDQDYDGVTNREEVEGLEITWEQYSENFGLPGELVMEQVVSSVTSRDTDGDGLSDPDEYYRYPPTNPNSADTDNDGLSDFAEVNGVSPAVGSGSTSTSTDTSEGELSSDPVYYTNPNDADSDNDRLKDGEELEGWLVRILGQATTIRVTSNPTRADEDIDGLMDYDERINQTDPNNSNTDGDQFNLSDKDETLLGTDPTDPEDICVRFTYVETTVASDGLDVDNSGKLRGDLNMDLTTQVSGVPTTEKLVISQQVSGFDSTWYNTGTAVAQGYSAVRPMKRGSYATAKHNAFSYYETASYTNLPNEVDFIVNYSDFTADQQIITGEVSSSYIDIKVNSKFTAAILSATDIDEHNLEAFCRPKVAIPDVTGLATSEAIEQISLWKFRLGNISRELSESVAAGLVISQSPSANLQEATQTAIDIVVSNGAITVPDLIGMTYSEAIAALDQLNLDANVTEEEDASVQQAAITDQSPVANEIVAEGATINFTLTVPVPEAPAP